MHVVEYRRKGSADGYKLNVFSSAGEACTMMGILKKAGYEFVVHNALTHSGGHHGRRLA